MKLLLIFLFTIPTMAISSPLKIGVIEYPPHIETKTKVISGKALDYVKKVLQMRGIEAKFEAVTLKRGVEQLQLGNLDLLFPISQDDSPKKIINIKTHLFRSTPGLCFQKKNFISILSATHRFNGLSIGFPAGSKIVPSLRKSKAKLKPLGGTNIVNRGIKMLIAGRFDAFYTPNPQKIYHNKNIFSKQVACSYFHGFSRKVYISVSPKLDKEIIRKIDIAFTNAAKNKSYEYFYAENQ